MLNFSAYKINSWVTHNLKRLDTLTFTYATLTFITEALRLVTRVQLLLMTVTLN